MKKIGLLADVSGAKFAFNIAYWNWAQRFGDQVEIFSPLDKDLKDFDLLILPGGADVLPARYGEYLEVGLCGEPNFQYEQFDSLMLPKYIEQGTPIFGICRGLQTINVHYNGSLHQHVWSEPSSAYRSQLVHEIRTNKGLLSVNSLHHQTIKQKGDGLLALAYSLSKKEKKEPQKDRYIEAIRHEKDRVAAVQFHPEELFDSNEAKAKETTEWVDNLVKSIMK